MNSIGDSSEKKVLVVGELLVDMISDTNIDSLAVSAHFSTNQGGSSANLCANLKWLGVDAELFATVGDDNLGSFLINELKTVGLSDTYIRRAEHKQTSIVVIAKNEHTPDFIPYRNADFDISSVEDVIINNSALIHSTAFALSKQPARRNILSAFEQAKRMGKVISIDWNFAPSIYEDDDGKEIFEKIMRLNPLLKISIDDLQRFQGKSLTIQESTEWLSHLDIPAICLTCGGEGVWYKTKNQDWKYKEALQVDHVNGVTGAGDAFWSGFLSAFINDLNIDECIIRALEIAKLKIEKPYPLYKNSIS